MAATLVEGYHRLPPGLADFAGWAMKLTVMAVNNALSQRGHLFSVNLAFATHEYAVHQSLVYTM